MVLPAPSRMFDDGGVQERVQLIRPATRERMTKAELDASNWHRTDERHWRMLWDHEIREPPTHHEPRFWLASGLPIGVNPPPDQGNRRRWRCGAGNPAVRSRFRSIVSPPSPESFKRPARGTGHEPPEDPRERAVFYWTRAHHFARRAVEDAWHCGQALNEAKAASARS